MMRLGLLDKTGKAMRDYAEERKKVFIGTLKSIEGRVRKGNPAILEAGIPPGLSTEFAETSKKARIAAIRKALRNFDVYKNFEEKKIV